MPIKKRFNKVISMLVVMLLLVAMLPSAAFAASDLGYEVNDSTGALTSYIHTGSDTNVVIPDAIKGVAIKSIGDAAFARNGNGSITSVTIPSAVTSIGASFWSPSFHLSNLTSVTFATDSQLKTIGTDAFNSTKITDITIPSSVTSIGDRAFASTPLTSIIIPIDSELVSIGFQAFDGARITEITLPASLTSITWPQYTFPSTLTTIKGFAGTYAEELATQYGYTFIDLGGGTVITVDKTALDAAIAGAAALAEADYTADSWVLFASALSAAQIVSDDTDATQIEVDDALAALEAAIAALVIETPVPTVDKTALDAAIAGVAALVEADYTADSWATFASALSAAQIVSGDTDATQIEVDNALLTLNDAIAALELAETTQPNGDYTVSLVSSTTSVYPGETVTIDVVVEGDDYLGSLITLDYDKDLFELTSWTGPYIPSAYNTTIVQVADPSNVVLFKAGTIATLTFTAKAVADTSDGAFTITTADISTEDGFLGAELQAARINVTVTVVKQFTVTFFDKDGELIASYNVDSGDFLSEVPEAPEVENYIFTGWDNNGTLYSESGILELDITSDIEFTAAYAPGEVTVTFIPEDSFDGANTATYGTDYTATIIGYDPAAKEYSVSYTIGDGDAQIATIADDGSITIDGNDIIGDIVITLTTTSIEFSVEVIADYVTGYSLVLIKNANGSDNVGYEYDGKATFYVDRYEAFAYIVEGTVTVAEAKANIAASDTAAVIIAITYDVNNSGTIGINDVTTTGFCYTVRTDLVNFEDHMDIYLRADVNGDYKVDGNDMAAVLTAII